MPAIGAGPVCPINHLHGRLYVWDDGRYFCPTNSHGGNGRFFTEEQANGDIQDEDLDLSDLYRSAAGRVLSGHMSMDQAVMIVGRQTGQPSAAIRENINLMLKTIQEEGETMAEKRQKAKAAAAAEATTTTERAPRARKEKAGPEEFKAVIEAAGLTNAQAARAAVSAGLGGSATYIYILTHKGASKDLLAKFTDAIAEFGPLVLADEAKAATEAAPAEA